MSELVLAHGAPELKLTHFESLGLLDQVGQAANQALFSVKRLVVEAEHSLDSIAEYFGIHSFAHHIASKNLTGCTLVLTADHHLEIHRPNVAHVTRFPVIRKIVEAANDDRFALAA